MSPISRRRIAGIVLAVAFCSVSWSTAQAADCDRDCLRGHITQYLDALGKRDPSSLPLASKVKFTEDSKELKVGEGLWKTAARLRSYRQDFLDVKAGVAGSHLIIEEGAAPALKPLMFALRLKIVDRKITEIETFTVRNEKEGAIFDVDNLKAASAPFAYVPPRSQLHSRAEAIRIADYYPAGLKAGSFEKVDAPFSADAYRFENGRLMAGPGCTSRAECGNIKTQPSPERPTLKSRLFAVDEEAGIVWYWLEWDRPENRKMRVWEAFKVYGGQMHAVEAFIKLVPASLGSGWD